MITPGSPSPFSPGEEYQFMEDKRAHEEEVGSKHDAAATEDAVFVPAEAEPEEKGDLEFVPLGEAHEVAQGAPAAEEKRRVPIENASNQVLHPKQAHPNVSSAAIKNPGSQPEVSEDVTPAQMKQEISRATSGLSRKILAFNRFVFTSSARKDQAELEEVTQAHDFAEKKELASKKNREKRLTPHLKTLSEAKTPEARKNAIDAYYAERERLDIQQQKQTNWKLYLTARAALLSGVAPESLDPDFKEKVEQTFKENVEQSVAAKITEDKAISYKKLGIGQQAPTVKRPEAGEAERKVADVERKRAESPQAAAPKTVVASLPARSLPAVQAAPPANNPATPKAEQQAFRIIITPPAPPKAEMEVKAGENLTSPKDQRMEWENKIKTGLGSWHVKWMEQFSRLNDQSIGPKERDSLIENYKAEINKRIAHNEKAGEGSPDKEWFDNYNSQLQRLRGLLDQEKKGGQKRSLSPPPKPEI